KAMKTRFEIGPPFSSPPALLAYGQRPVDEGDCSVGASDPYGGRNQPPASYSG
ncbi:14089_t:CDS:1, partial [Acaulospora colombiana]